MAVHPIPASNYANTPSLATPNTSPGGVNPTPISGYGTVLDLATQDYVSNVLAAGGVTLTSAQNAIVATLITAASREIIRFCGRRFDLAAYDEILTPEGGRQDRGEPATAKLGNFPVVGVTSVRTGRATVLTVSNVDSATNQLASVAFAGSGDVEYHDLTYTGVNLSRTASGTTTTNSLSFTTYTTVQALADAINALSGGWSATVASGTPTPGLLGTSELVGVREPKNAFSPGASLDAFTLDASSYDIDRRTGICRFFGLGGWGGYGGAWGAAYGPAYDGLGNYTGVGTLGWNQYRVVYTAGFATIPEAVAQVCAEAVKLMFARLSSDPSLKSETTGNYSWAAKDALKNLSDDARMTLALYRDNWI